MLGTDGTAWTVLDSRDGLPDNLIISLSSVAMAACGSAATQRGSPVIARRREAREPSVTLTSTRAERTPAGLPRIQTEERVSFKFGVVDSAPSRTAVNTAGRWSRASPKVRS